MLFLLPDFFLLLTNCSPPWYLLLTVKTLRTHTPLGTISGRTRIFSLTPDLPLAPTYYELRTTNLLSMPHTLIIAQQTVSMVEGGPLTQLRETARHLPACGYEVSYFDQWERFDPERYDVVHVFGANFMTYDTVRRLTHFGVPYVVSPIFFTRRSPRVIRLIRRASGLLAGRFGGVRTDYDFTAEICRGARFVLPNTSDEARLIAEGMGVPEERIEVVPNGVDTRFAEATPDLFEREYGVRDFVLNVGHIGSGRKNVLRLIESMEGVDADLVLIGKIHRGRYAEACLRAAGRNGRVRIIEGLANDSPLLASAYAACRVFALPSLFETPGIAALEAAVAGAAVVITPHGGTRDYFADRATYVDPTSVDSIRRGIHTALAKGPATDLADHVAGEFAWERVAERTAGVYGRVG